jgi:hypothetical protein
MDRLIWLAWRAFWVGLGAAVVLVGQTMLAPPPAESAGQTPIVAPAPRPAPPPPLTQPMPRT